MWRGFGGSDVRKPPGSWKVSDLDISVDSDSQPATGASSGSDGPSRECTAGGQRVALRLNLLVTSAAPDPQPLNDWNLLAPFGALMLQKKYYGIDGHSQATVWTHIRFNRI